jgi:hypothetical protein
MHTPNPFAMKKKKTESVTLVNKGNYSALQEVLHLTILEKYQCERLIFSQKNSQI